MLLLQAHRISFGFVNVNHARSVKWLKSTGRVNVNDTIELLRQLAIEIMAVSLCIGFINNSDSSFHSVFAELVYWIGKKISFVLHFDSLTRTKFFVDFDACNVASEQQ
jgi:hypothetical protein